MEEQIKQSNQTLHRYLFTVTTFSKILAMILFIILPFVGFYLGIKYQQKVTVSPTVISEVQKHTTLTPTSIITTTKTPIPGTYDGKAAYESNLMFTLTYPLTCTEQARNSKYDTNNWDYVSSNTMIYCLNGGLRIGTNSGGHGTPMTWKGGEPENILLGTQKWTKSLYLSRDDSKYAHAIYNLITPSKDNILIEVSYSNYSTVNETLVEQILTTIKFTK